MRFEKWQSLGNDYIVLERDRLPFALSPSRVRALCDAHVGVGSDGVLLLSPPTGPGPVAELRIFNPDGSEAELSGNGARQAVMYLRSAGWTDAEKFSIQTAAGEIRPTIHDERNATLEMGRARLRSEAFPAGGDDGVGELEAAGRRWRFQHVSVGNPQCAIVLDELAELERLDLPSAGGAIERHVLFPRRTNVSFSVVLAPNTLRTRIFERGVGETMASGTGAMGAAVTHVLRGGKSPVRVRLDGGELTVAVAADLQIELTGPATPVFAGELSEPFLEELDATE